MAVSNAKEIQKPLLEISGIEEAEQGASAEEAEVEALQQQNLSSIDTSKAISMVPGSGNPGNNAFYEPSPAKVAV